MATQLRTIAGSHADSIGIEGVEEIGTAVFDSVASQIAVLDRSGVIVAVNAAWRLFAAENGLDSDQFELRAAPALTTWMSAANRRKVTSRWPVPHSTESGKFSRAGWRVSRLNIRVTRPT